MQHWLLPRALDVETRSLTSNLFVPILAVAESPGIDVVIPAGATVDYQSIESVFGVMDLRWDGKAYFANVEDVLDGCWPPDANMHGSSVWAN